jgi:hypothetical protein
MNRLFNFINMVLWRNPPKIAGETRLEMRWVIRSWDAR